MAYKRHRQAEPTMFDKRSFRMITLSKKKGVRAVVGCPKGHFHVPKGKGAKGHCDVGMKIQSILVRRQR
jgi:hypothetical protein